MLEWPNATIYQGIDEVAAQEPNRTAVIYDGTEISYQALIDESREFAVGLAALGVEPGDLVAVWLGNRPEWITAQLATSYLGAGIVAVNTRYRRHELKYMLADSGATALFMDESFLGHDYVERLTAVVPEARSQTPGEFSPADFSALEHVITLNETELKAARLYASIKARGEAIDAAEDAGAPACVFYTSGTTSDPKGCLQSNRSLINHSHRVGVHLDVTETDVALGAAPFCGVFGYNIFMSALTHGIPLVVQPHFSPPETLQLIDTYDVTYFSAIGEMYLRLIDHDAFTREKVESIERGAVAFVGVPDIGSALERIETAVGFPVVQPYGLSEANSQIFIGDPTDPMDRRKRVGGPMIHPGYEEAKIVDPATGERQPTGEEGELCLRGYNVMHEYLGKPQKTAEVFDTDGWLHTGDLCVRDDYGYLFYKSRLDDALRVRGFLVGPREIEAAIDAHPMVRLAQVVGTDHPRHGEVPIAFVKREDPTLTKDELYGYLEDAIADFKVPERVIFVETFPRTEGPHGAKIQKHELRDRVTDLYS